jgi:hypothetical protein
MSGAAHRWAERAVSPMTDEELHDALAWEIGDCGGGGSPDGPDYHYRASGLRLWGGWTYPREKDEPLFKGALTMAMARKVYGIKTPEEYREPSLFDFANCPVSDVSELGSEAGLIG